MKTLHLCRYLIAVGLLGVRLLTVAPASAGEGVTLGNVTISADTTWDEDTYAIETLTVTNGATLTIAGGSTLNVSGSTIVTAASTMLLQGKDVGAQIEEQWQGVGVTINTVDLRVDAGSVISADAQGYLGGMGPGAGGSDVQLHGGGGGGHGGVGGLAGDLFNSAGPAYGDAFEPAEPGSGGGPTSAVAGSGGGAITINVTGTLMLDGMITANAAAGGSTPCSAAAAGGGSGGSIFVTTATLIGTGSMTAKGGDGGSGGCFPTVGDDGGGGSGGRIAVYYQVAQAFTGFTASSVNGAVGGGHTGAAGTMVFVDTSTDTVRISENLDIAPDSSVTFAGMIVDDAARLTLGGGSTLTVENEFVVTGNSTVIVQGKDINGQVSGAWAGTGVMIHARNLRVDEGSAISADAQGYVSGLGPGAGGSNDGAHVGSGGGYGGIGGRAGDGINAGGPVYGDAFEPIAPGSGGGPTSVAAGSGGGAIRLSISDTLTLDGTIAANGSDGGSVGCSLPAAGGGSGGSIYITTSTIAGSGSVTANGGAGGVGGCFPTVGDDGGGGAGGRIAVYYRVGEAFTGFTSSSVNGAVGGGHIGASGTMIFVDTSTDTLHISQNLVVVPDSSITFGAVTVDDGATLTLGGGSTFTVENDFIVTGNSTIVVEGKNTVGQVSGEWVGAGATINARNLRVNEGSAISADAQGYAGGQGPGTGGSDGSVHSSGGGGYGGTGGRAGDGFNAGGSAYGDAFAPIDPGSGGGPTNAAAGSGGGAITLKVTDTLTLDGTITADGDPGQGSACSAAAPGGGSGGSIFVTTTTLRGMGSVRADGGAGGVGGCTGPGDDGGGGAGGRIAVLYAQDGGFAGFLTSRVDGGVGGVRAASPGTLAFLNTATNALRVSQHLDFAADAVVRFGALTLDDEATLVLGGGAQLTIDNDFLVTQNSTVFIEGKAREGQIDGQWSGIGATIDAGAVRIDSGSTITASEQGYLAAVGPGAGGSDGMNTAGGGGYGGAGGSGNGPNPGGLTYGSASAPVDLGSGGGLAHTPAGIGGGAFTLYADTLQLDGMIVANGSNGSGVGCSGAAPGGGSGGSLLIVTRSLAGAGSLHADGGDGGEGGCTGSGDDGGGGGGGRIAVHYRDDQGFAGVTTSTVDGGVGGAGRNGAPGTLLFIGCAGDCSGDGRVTVDELVRMVNIALGNTNVRACLAGDTDRNGTIAVNEIVAAVNVALGSCNAG